MSVLVVADKPKQRQSNPNVLQPQKDVEQEPEVLTLLALWQVGLVLVSLFGVQNVDQVKGFDEVPVNHLEVA